MTMKTHRERYPEQYRHPMIGRRVKHAKSGTCFMLERVVPTRFGLLAMVPGSDIAYPVRDLKEVCSS
jgi:hypothetical protein